MALSVRFFQAPLHMTFLSDKEGRPIYEPRDYVRIEIPGMVANVVETLVSEEHKRAHPLEWAQYLNEKSTGEFSEYQGTLLSAWPLLNSAQVLEMRHYKFYTVEQIADASDQQIQGIGMLAGMSPLSLRDKAKAWLGNAKGQADVNNAASELAKRDEQIATMQMHMDALMKKVEDMSRPKVGRPAKEPA